MAQSPRQKLVKDIELSLGGGIVDVELDADHYHLSIDHALDRYRQRSSNATEESMMVLALTKEQSDYVLPEIVIEVKDVYSATIPVASRESAFAWLRDNDLGDLIKNEVTVSFGRGEDDKATQYAVLAKGQGYEPVQKLKVEPMTLKALVRERIEAGQDMPSDLFNLFAGSRTNITRKQ